MAIHHALGHFVFIANNIYMSLHCCLFRAKTHKDRNMAVSFDGYLFSTASYCRSFVVWMSQGNPELELLLSKKPRCRELTGSRCG